MFYSNNSKKGFTLIEMIVSLGIFSVVAVIALGALMRIISANQKAQAIQAAVTNLSFALESMSREIRMGTEFPLSTNNGTYISFVPTKSSATCKVYYAYRFKIINDAVHLQKAEGTCGISPTSFSEDSYIDVTSSNITIQSGNFTISENALYPYKLITIQLAGFAGDKEKNKSYFDLTTAVSARVQ